MGPMHFLNFYRSFNTLQFFLLSLLEQEFILFSLQLQYLLLTSTVFMKKFNSIQILKVLYFIPKNHQTNKIFAKQGAMLIFGAFHLHIVVLGMFLFPPSQAFTHPLNFFKNKTDSTASNRNEVITFIGEDVNGNCELQEKVVPRKGL